MKPLIAALAVLLIAATPLPQPSPLQGTWRNPKGTVEVSIGSCDAGLCGTVIAASAAAIADARDSGYPSLVGMQLLHDYRADGPRKWQGMIFVPDLGRNFSSHIELVDADHLRVSGCLLGKLICKSQLWRRS
jgi:uncharacterized protein (DUF2147 family)